MVMPIKTVKDLRTALIASEKDVSYPTFFYTSSGHVLSSDSIKKNLTKVVRAIKNKNDSYDNKAWKVIGIDINWENPDLYDDETGERIPSAYPSVVE